MRARARRTRFAPPSPRLELARNPGKPILIYNTGGTMVPNRRILALALVVLPVVAFARCASRDRRPLVDPFPLRFPLAEGGRLEIEGPVVGQPWAKDGVVYYASPGGELTAVVVPWRTVLWRKPAGQSGPDAGRAGEPAAAAQVPALTVDGPVLRARDPAGQELWTFTAAGTISSGPVRHDDRVYIGTGERWFYSLKAGDGRKVWSRRLQGAPAHPAVVAGGSVFVAASNSVVYRLSAKGGSILSWETVPSRVLYPPAAAGPLVLIGSAGSDLVGLDVKTGRRAGQFRIDGVLAAGPVWSPPFVVLFVEDRDSGRQRLVFLRSR
jgi:outer membrane protein assembly factor BamB